MISVAEAIVVDAAQSELARSDQQPVILLDHQEHTQVEGRESTADCRIPDLNRRLRCCDVT